MAYAFNRLNPQGRQYFITAVSPHETEIRTVSISSGEWKRIVVPCSAERISQGWYDWIHDGHFVQHAFDFLTNDEREFLITGMTPEEWKAIFEGEEETNEVGDE